MLLFKRVDKPMIYYDPGNMSIEELEEYIKRFPANSACDRARLVKLQEILRSKKLKLLLREEV